jgi:hypothetical protein
MITAVHPTTASVCNNQYLGSYHRFSYCPTCGLHSLSVSKCFAAEGVLESTADKSLYIDEKHQHDREEQTISVYQSE